MPSYYQLASGAKAGNPTVGIPVGAYDTTRDLIIDPVVLVRSGLIGGAGNDQGLDLAVDAAGNTYIAGTTNSAEDTFPVTVGPDATHAGTGATDAYVAKLDPTGALVYAGYIGGDGIDTGLAIAIDSDGSAYVTGATTSTPETLPATVGPDLTPDAANNSFVAKVDPAGTALVYAGYISAASAQAIAVDGSGNAYVSGSAGSPEEGFPAAGGPDVTYNGGFIDAFVAKVDASGTGFAYAGYIGGADFERAFGIAVDGSGNAYVTGETASNHASFPVKVGPDLTFNVRKSRTPTPGRDAFVAKVDGAGNLVYAGYIGGLENEQGVDVAVDAGGNAYVAGNTASRSFPVTRGAFDRSYGGGFFFDGFLAKVNPSGTGLVYAGFIGSDTIDNADSVAVDAAGAAYVTGLVGITTNFPTPGGFDTTHNGATDAFAVKVNPAGTDFEWGTYLGGSSGDAGRGIGFDGAGDVYVAGGTSSPDFPVVGSPVLTLSGVGDAFVAKLDQTP